MSEENTSTYENIEEENSIGHVQIAGEVIAIIAGLAATEVDGVSRLAGSLSNELASRLGKKNPAKGVKVELQCWKKGRKKTTNNRKDLL